MNKEQHSTRYSKIIETLRLSSQSGSNLPEFLDLGVQTCKPANPFLGAVAIEIPGLWHQYCMVARKDPFNVARFAHQRGCIAYPHLFPEDTRNHSIDSPKMLHVLVLSSFLILPHLSSFVSIC
ncbi:hypothetical protein CCP4SC76_4370001 [Gammaproteobacteria bacterium]